MAGGVSRGAAAGLRGLMAARFRKQEMEICKAADEASVAVAEASG